MAGTDWNPEHSPGRLPVRVMSQGHQGNYAHNDDGIKHILTADAGLYGDIDEHDQECSCSLCTR